MSRSKSASSLINLETGGYDWRSGASTPPGGRDWRAAISTPLNYRLGSSTLHFRPHLILVGGLIMVAVLFLIYSAFGGRKSSKFIHLEQEHGHVHSLVDHRYPLSDALYSSDMKIFKIAIISDLDQDSKAGDNSWKSYIRYGELRVKLDYSKLEINISQDEQELTSNVGSGGRGMELSELSVFNGKLYTVDDRTGIVYQILKGKVVPWVILSDGPGNQTKGFKSEWSTVKDDHLWIGGLGKEWTTPGGDVINTHPMYVKKINYKGEVEHIDWHQNYLAVRESAGIKPPGYMIHEAVCWSSHLSKWVFLPRRASKEKYDDVMDEKRGTNLMILADEKFKSIQTKTVGKIEPTHGFSSFKFLPGSQDRIIIALKSEEFEGNISTYVLAFDIQGKILLPEQKIADKKFEGIEFI